MANAFGLGQQRVLHGAVPGFLLRGLAPIAAVPVRPTSSSMSTCSSSARAQVLPDKLGQR